MLCRTRWAMICHVDDFCDDIYVLWNAAPNMVTYLLMLYCPHARVMQSQGPSPTKSTNQGKGKAHPHIMPRSLYPHQDEPPHTSLPSATHPHKSFRKTDKYCKIIPDCLSARDLSPVLARPRWHNHGRPVPISRPPALISVSSSTVGRPGSHLPRLAVVNNQYLSARASPPSKRQSDTSWFVSVRPLSKQARSDSLQERPR